MSQNTTELRVAVTHAQEMLQHNAFEPALQQGKEILKSFPLEPNALFIMGCSLRGLQRFEDAKKILQQLVLQTNHFALAHQELAFTLQSLKESNAAISSLKNAVKSNEKLPQSWKLLSELLLQVGDNKGSEHAYNNFLRHSTQYPQLGEALKAFVDGKFDVSEKLCRSHLKQFPDDVSALRLLAEVAIKLGIFVDAERLLVRCLTLAPDYQLARLNYAHVLNKREKSLEALEQINILEKIQPGLPPQQIIKASILVRLGQFKDAIEIYDKLITKIPNQANLLTSRGHALKTVGKQSEAIASYRQAITSTPSWGEAYWSLANLKTFSFDETEIMQMQRELSNTRLTALERVNICFALGKALEDNKAYDESFSYYQQGNEIKEKLERYDANETTGLINRTITVCEQSVFAQQKKQGCHKADPIFIVGLPRSGSTLLEQILASHSQVDGTKELPDIIAMVRKLSGRVKHNDISKYPEIIANLTPQQLKELGEEYLSRTQVHRGSAPFFIDKMPNNFAHIGLIKLILPNAKIIDARRHPMSACFSGFKQLFTTGQAFTYGLENIGKYYIDYIKLMDHWHSVLPQQVLTVNYEEVVNDFENQVRKILSFCGLAFEQSCLEFYNNQRAVNTASSEQVRQPIYQSGLNAWSAYEEHLMPLKNTLKPLLNK